MQTIVPNKIQDHLKAVATRFSKEVEERIAEIQQETQSRLDRDAAERARFAQKEKEEKDRQAQWLARRMPLARIGLKRIIEVGKSEPVQKIISDLKRIQQFSGVMMFYEAHRFSGEAFDLPDKDVDFVPGTRDVEFFFFADSLRIFCGSLAASNGTTWKILYKSPHADKAVLRSDPPRNEEQSIEDFLATIKSPYPSNMALARHWRQRRLEWDPYDIAFQLLVSCARPARLNNYLKGLRPAVAV